MSIALGIDPGSRKGLGWAVVGQGPTEQTPHCDDRCSGYVRVGLAEGTHDRTPLWEAVKSVILRAYERHNLDVICYEQVMRHSGVYAAHLYGGQVGVIQMVAASLGIPTHPVPVQTVKRVLGCRAAGKDKVTAMVEAAHAMGYHHVVDHNEADAIGIALAGLEWLKTSPKKAKR